MIARREAFRIARLAKAARQERRIGSIQGTWQAALSESIKTLPPDTLRELFVLMRMGKGEIDRSDWSRALDQAAKQDAEKIAGEIVADAELSRHLRRALSRSRRVFRGMAAGFAPSILLAFYAPFVWETTGAAGKNAGLYILYYILIGTAVCGPAFAFLYDRLPGSSWLRGVIFGMAMWLLEMLVIVPLAGGTLFATNIGRWAALMIFLFWGAILGNVFGRISPLNVSRRKASLVVGSAWIGVVAVLVSIRTFLFHPFNMIGGAMLPGLSPGDIVLVSKSAYGYSHYSLPFSPPLFSGRMFASPPARGDAVIFRSPADDRQDSVSRILGLPGDRIQIIKNVLYINDAAVRRVRVGDFVDDRGRRATQWRETLGNDATYLTLVLSENSSYADTPVYRVPPGNYFMIGDYRDNASDSRDLKEVGYVPFENIIGPIKATLLRSRR